MESKDTATSDENQQLLDQWPKEGGVNPIDMKSSFKGDVAKLFNYRYPVPKGRKGIVFFVHGYGGQNTHRASLAKMFAEQGYEMCGIDQRG